MTNKGGAKQLWSLNICKLIKIRCFGKNGYSINRNTESMALISQYSLVYEIDGR